MQKLFRHLREFFPPEAAFAASMYLVFAVCFGVLRLLLLVLNSNLGEAVPASVLLQSFWVGLRFDLAIGSYLLIPLFLVLLLLRGRARTRVLVPFNLLVVGLLLLGVAEAEFYREFESRFNSLVFEYLSQPGTVGAMIWDGYPVLRYLALWAVLAVIFLWMVSRLQRRFLAPRRDSVTPRSTLLRTMGATVMLTLMVFAGRGGFAHEPLRWGDAFFSGSTFANHLALNGVFTLGRSAWDKIYGKQAFWTKSVPVDQALQTTREMLALEGETPLYDDQHPLLRSESPPTSTVPLRGEPGKPVNVVVILMESFSGRLVGALGSPANLTPQFDRLAGEGILFERAFSSGTHTHQGVYASLTSFPNLPGYEYLMKMMEANQEFSSLPMLMQRDGYQTVFLYNGLFSWDNKEGFFRQHGMERFVGTEDYVNPSFRDPVWGVGDYDVFMRANEEFRELNKKGPFFGAILTLSNHQPYNLPDPLPFEPIRTGDQLEGRFNAMHYADWSLGQFFEKARHEEYFNNTLFVITGDHGFGILPMITGMQIERFHIPMLFYSPGLLGTKGERRRTVVSQVDIGPSIFGLLGKSDPHQGWGRNLFSPSLQDDGFAVVKPSGGEERVALIEDDRLLLVAPKETPKLYRFDLDFPPQSSEDLYREEKPLAKQMEQRLLSYVQTGILSLRGRKLGVPEETMQAEMLRGISATTARRD